jgi:hypothetical protein
LFVLESREEIWSELCRTGATAITREPEFQFAADKAMDPLRIDPGSVGRCQAMGTEAQTKQVGPLGSQLLEVALVVVAVRQTVKVQRLREDRRDAVACDI